MTARTIRIAVVQSPEGRLTCCGPDDYEKDCAPDAMHAAIRAHLENGELPAGYYWIEAELPALPTIPELKAMTARGEFPKYFIDEMETPPTDPGPQKPPSDFGALDDAQSERTGA